MVSTYSEFLLSDAETKLEKIYEAALAGSEVIEEENGIEEVEMDEEVVRILKEVDSGKKEIKTVDLSGRKLSIFLEVFGKMKSFKFRMLEDLDVSFNKLTYLPTNIGDESQEPRAYFRYVNDCLIFQEKKVI